MDDKIECLEKRMESLEGKVDSIMEMVTLGKHLFTFAKFLAWVGGIYISVETYIKTFPHK